MLPHLVYEDVEAAIAWLGKVFGFAEHYRYGQPGGPVSGAQMHLGKAWIMVNRAKRGWASPATSGYASHSLTVFVEEVEKHFERARTGGARIVEELHQTEYGELQYGELDLEGHHWLFSRHARNVNPEAWGARMARR